MRFEDLKNHPIKAMSDMFAFLLEVPSIEGTVCEERIKQVAARNHEERAIYRLKSNSKSLSRNKEMYSKIQNEAMKEQLKDFNLFFGYIDHPAEKSETPFFNYTKEDGSVELDL